MFSLKRLLSKTANHRIFVLCNCIVLMYRILQSSRLKCHSGVIHQATKTCSQTQNKLLMNGIERELRTTPFSFSNCDTVNDKFLHTCKGTILFHLHQLLIVMHIRMSDGNII